MNSARESKKRKNSNRIRPQDIVPASEDENPSPKKRNKIPPGSLSAGSITERKNFIGGILTLPELHDGAIRIGEIKNVRIICTVTENRVGRRVSTIAERSGNRFVYLADCTGFLELNVDATKVGIRKYDTPCGECTDETRNFFNAIVTGHIAWLPSRKSPQHPTFFLNKGSVEKIELNAWSGNSRFMLPTTDVCTQMVKSPFGGTALFGTTGICGRVYYVCESRAGVLVILLEDPVGYSKIEIHPVRDDETANSLIHENSIVEGAYLFIKGKLKIWNFPQRENAILEMASTEGTITSVWQSNYLEYAKSLSHIEVSFFKGVEPEGMENM